MHRSPTLQTLSTTDFDVLVVGGGITGCGVARDAALRGLRTALVEKDDFASGTSSRSSRLVHGGVRYLEHGHLRLVFEASAERRRLLRLAPHLVRPLAFTWPVYVGARVARWKLRAGLTLYDLLALFRNVERHHALSAAAVESAEPRIRRDGLRGGARYYDAATDDARLTLANALDAANAGAVLLNHAGATAWLRDVSGRVCGARVHDSLGGRDFEVRARVVVNATGPWSDRVANGHEGHTAIRGSKGVHIAVPAARIGNHGACTVLSPVDQRVMFVLPGPHGQTVIGTTDSFTTASPDEMRATEADVAYLLESANWFFPDAQLTRADVIAAWAGIRPLIASSAKGEGSPAAASREHEVTRKDGVVTVTGGKLTTYRVMAADVMFAVLAELGRHATPSPTRERPLPGGSIGSLAEVEAEARRATGDDALGLHLARTYGGEWDRVLEAIRTDGGVERIDASLPYTTGEMRHAVRHEMASTLGDLLIRRTKLAFETRDHGRAVAPCVAAAVAPLLGWTAAGVDHALADYAAETKRIFSVEP